MAKEVWLLWNDKLYRQEGGRLVEGTAKAAKRGYVGALLPAGLIRAHSFKLPVSLGEDRFATQVEITMYEESGLDVEREYVIGYRRHRLDFEDSWLVEAFAAETAPLQEAFGRVLKRVGHIDLLAVPYLMYEALYAHGALSTERNDLFIYLGETESYAVLCKEGRYIAHRNLPSLASMALKAQVTPEVLAEMMAQKGLRQSDYPPEESLLYVTIQDTLGTMADRIAQTVNHKRGIFGLEGVDGIYLDFGGREIPGLWELLEGYGLNASRKGVVPSLLGGDGSTARQEAAMAYVQKCASNDLEPINLTVFQKRPSFWSTHTGKLVGVAAVSAVLTVAGGLYERQRLEKLQQTRLTLQKRLDAAIGESKRLKKRLEALRRKTADLQKQSKLLQRQIEAYDEAADVMTLVIASKVQRRKMVADVDEALKRYGLSATAIEQNGSRRMSVDILTRYRERDKIAKFMGRLLANGYRGVETQRIELDKDLYKSRVEIAR